MFDVYEYMNCPMTTIKPYKVRDLITYIVRTSKITLKDLRMLADINPHLKFTICPILHGIRRRQQVKDDRSFDGHYYFYRSVAYYHCRILSLR